MGRWLVCLTLLLTAWVLPNASVQAQTQGGFVDRIPEVLVPEPLGGQIRTDVGGSRVPLRVEGEDLPEFLSPELSTACSQLLFNQKQQGKLFVVVPYETGPARSFGYASGTGRNLRDERGLRQPNRVYLFLRDGTSDCQVFDLARQF